MEVFDYAYKSIADRKARTALTMLGVIIGIAAVVALISLGNGLTEAVSGQLEQLGKDRIIVTPKTSGGFSGQFGASVKLDSDALREIRNIRNVDIALPIVMKKLPVEFKGQTLQLTALGVFPEESENYFQDIQHFEFVKGRGIREGESAVVLGGKVPDLFKDTVEMKNRIEVINKTFRTVGILKATGNQRDDKAVIMDIDTLRGLIKSPDEITFILVNAHEHPKETAKKIEQELEKLYDDDLFSAFTTEELIENINNVFGILSSILTGIAAVSLLVASFGITNTMLISVLERTKEIGIMKAIGATNNRIVEVFLIESAIVGILGGVLGGIFGFILSSILTGIAESFVGVGVTTQFDITLYIGAVLFSGFVGILSGTYPAYRAAKLDPVEALRKE